jgi:chromosomal replication initiator protein
MTVRRAKDTWEAVLGQLQLQVTRPSYQTWLSGTVGLSHTGNELVVGTPNPFVAEMLEQRMYSLISQTVERVVDGPVDIRFQVVAEGNSARPDEAQAPRSPSTGAQPRTPARSTTAERNGDSRQLPLFGRLTLNAKFTFDNYVVGRSNELACAAAAAVSDKPGAIYNPLVIYSAVGLGKTHLLHSIGHKLKADGLAPMYTTTEEFTNEYIKAIREGRTEEFRNRYRSADALLLDDIQFLIGKEQTQEGFFHTFNALHMANRQIVVTSDRPITALSLLEDRVRSRLAGGLVVDIQPPDLETRIAILRAKAEVMAWDVRRDVIDHLGERIHNNVRDLEGRLNRLVAYARLNGSPVTLEMLSQANASLAESGVETRIDDRLVLDTVAEYFQLRDDDLKGRKRDRKTATARQVAMYLLREDSRLGPSAIGRILGGKDHTTVIHGCGRIASRLDTDPHLRRDVLNIRETFSSA